MGPLDFFDLEFYTNRKDRIDKKIEMIEAMSREEV
jgi:hypothetical protein